MFTGDFISKIKSLQGSSNLDTMKIMEKSKQTYLSTETNALEIYSLVCKKKNDANEWKYIGKYSLDCTPGLDHGGVSEVSRRWKLPPTGYIKCNVDDSYINSGLASTAGWVIRDDKGIYNGDVQAVGRKVGNALVSNMPC